MNLGPSALQHQRSTSQVYRILGQLWLVEFDETLLTVFSDDDLRNAFLSAGGEIPEPADLEMLAAEYCRLFVGPRDHCAPFQSVWQTGQLHGQLTDSVRRFAELAHSTRPPRAGQVMLDHLGMEMLIMADLVDGPLANRSPELVEQAAGEFFRRHLGWPAPLFDAAMDKEPAAFYASLIQMTQRFLSCESEQWESV